MRIQRFDPGTMLKPHRKVLYVGRSGAGKSVAMRAFLREMPPVDMAIAFTPTDETASELAKLIPGGLRDGVDRARSPFSNRSTSSSRDCGSFRTRLMRTGPTWRCNGHTLRTSVGHPTSK